MTYYPPLKTLAFLFLLTLTGYLLTLNPALFRNDSPETITSCVTLGIAHPPSYPLFTLLGRLFYPFQVGNPAFTYNFMAAIFGAMGACLLYLNLWTLLSKKPLNDSNNYFWEPKSLSCFAASLLLAFSNGYWGNSIAAKGGIYIFQIVIELTILLFLQNASTIDKAKTYRFSFLFSLIALGLTNHWPTEALIIPALVVFLVQPQNGADNIPKSVIIHTTLTVIALSLYLYLPLRSHCYPTLNFNAPFTYHQFVNSLLRIDYSSTETMTNDHSTLLSDLNDKSIYISHHLSIELSAWAYLFTAIGVFWLSRTNKKTALFLLTLLSITIFVNLLYLAVKPVEFWHLDDHLLSSNWVIALFTGCGLYITLTKIQTFRFGGQPIIKILSMAGVSLIVLFTVSLNLLANDQKNKFLYYGYGLSALRSMPKNAIYFSESDYDYFSTLYLTSVLKIRPDVHLLLMPFLVKPFERELLSKNEPTLLKTTTETSNVVNKGLFYDIINQNSGSYPIITTFSNGSFTDQYLSHFRQLALKPVGIVVQVGNWEAQRPISSHQELNDFWNHYLLPETQDPSPNQGLLRQACANPYLNAAQYERVKGNGKNWDWYYERALLLISDESWQAQTWFDKAEMDRSLGETAEAKKGYQISAFEFSELGQFEKAKTALQRSNL